VKFKDKIQGPHTPRRDGRMNPEASTTIYLIRLPWKYFLKFLKTFTKTRKPIIEAIRIEREANAATRKAIFNYKNHFKEWNQQTNK
jgi:hypothetical protein